MGRTGEVILTVTVSGRVRGPGARGKVFVSGTYVAAGGECAFICVSQEDDD